MSGVVFRAAASSDFCSFLSFSRITVGLGLRQAFCSFLLSDRFVLSDSAVHSVSFNHLDSFILLDSFIHSDSVILSDSVNLSDRIILFG